MRARFKCQGCIATLDTKKFHYSLYGVQQKGLSVIDYRGLIKFGGPFNANPLTSTDGEGLKKSTYYLTFVENKVKYGISCQRKHSLLKDDANDRTALSVGKTYFNTTMNVPRRYSEYTFGWMNSNIGYFQRKIELGDFNKIFLLLVWEVCFQILNSHLDGSFGNSPQPLKPSVLKLKKVTKQKRKERELKKNK